MDFVHREDPMLTATYVALEICMFYKRVMTICKCQFGFQAEIIFTWGILKSPLLLSGGIREPDILGTYVRKTAFLHVAGASELTKTENLCDQS